MINIELKDGSKKEVKEGLSVFEIAKEISEGLRAIIPQKEKSRGIDLKKIPRDELPAIVKDLTSQMQLAAANLDFERAADLRDQIEAIKTTLAAK